MNRHGEPYLIDEHIFCKNVSQILYEPRETNYLFQYWNNSDCSSYRTRNNIYSWCIIYKPGYVESICSKININSFFNHLLYSPFLNVSALRASLWSAPKDSSSSLAGCERRSGAGTGSGCSLLSQTAPWPGAAILSAGKHENCTKIRNK